MPPDSAIHTKNSRVWSLISYHLAKYFKSINQNSTALQLYDRGQELTEDREMIDSIKADKIEIKKFIQENANTDDEQNGKMEVDQETKS